MLSIASSARAQLTLLREHERLMDSTRLAVGIDSNMFFGNAHGSGYAFVQPTALAAFRYREVVLEGAMPFAYFHQNNNPGADHNRFSAGNPWAAILYLPDCDCGLSRLSVGIAPNVVDTHGPLRAMAATLARGAMGDWDGYLWLDDTMPLVIGASTRKQIKQFRLVWDADAIVGLPGAGRRTEAGGQMAGEADVMFGWRTTLGARLSGVYYPTLSGDQFQSALSTFLTYRRPSDTFGVRFVMNIDPPAGFAFSQAGMWSLGFMYVRSLFNGTQ